MKASLVATMLACIASFQCASLAAQPIINPDQAWGPVRDGIRMAISATGSGSATQRDVEFYVALQNAGPKDVVLNLGAMLGNGKVQEPAAIHFVLTDPKGAAREFECSSTRFLASRVDDFVVALPARATYILRLNLNQYCCQMPRMKLAGGRYRIVARFEGKGAQHVNLDTPGIRLMNFWIGAIQTNPLEFEIADQEP